MDNLFPDVPVSILKPKQLEVTKWVVQGYTNGQIATVMNISELTVKQHLRMIFDAVGCDNRTSLALWYAGNNLGDYVNDLRKQLSEMTAQRDRWKRRCSMGDLFTSC